MNTSDYFDIAQVYLLGAAIAVERVRQRIRECGGPFIFADPTLAIVAEWILADGQSLGDMAGADPRAGAACASVADSCEMMVRFHDPERWGLYLADRLSAERAIDMLPVAAEWFATAIQRDDTELVGILDELLPMLTAARAAAGGGR
jgi:hypothetical protein